MWFKTWYHLPAKEKINGFLKHEGCNSKHDITYTLKKRNRVCKHGGCNSKHDTTYQLRGKENGVRKYGGCDSKHDITYMLRKREMEFVSMEDVIQNTISLTF